MLPLVSRRDPVMSTLILTLGWFSEVRLVYFYPAIFSRLTAILPGDVVKTSNGDITSIKYNGKECQDQSKFTHLSSGLGSATVESKVTGNYAKVTIKTDTIVRLFIHL